MPRSDYTPPTFTDVPQSQWGSPPAGAVALDAARLNALAQAVGNSARQTRINVQDYGAVGNGTADDTAAIASAITAATSARKPLYFPTGDYKVTASLGAVDSRKVAILGDGPQLSRIVATGLAQGAWLLTLGWDNSSGPYPQLKSAVTGLSFIGETTSNACNGILLQGVGAQPQAHSLQFADVNWYGFGTQVSVGNYSFLDSFHRCRFDSAVTRGVSIDQPTNAGENISFVSCAFANSPGSLVYADISGADLSFYSCSFDYSARALDLRSGRAGFISCHFETDSTYSASATEFLRVNRRGSANQPMLSLTDCDFANNWDSYQTCIRLTGDTYGGNALRIVNPYVITTSTMTPYFVRDDGPTASDVAITGSWYSNAGYVPQIRDNAGNSYRLTAGLRFANRPERTVRRINSKTIEPFPAVTARGADTPDNGSLFATLFSPTEDITLTGLSFWTQGTAQAGATLIRVGLYDWDTSQASLHASSASDTTLAAAINTRYTKSFTTPYLCTAGGVYALAILIVGATTSPLLVSAGNPNEAMLRDATYGHPVCWRATGQTDLPNVVFNGSQFTTPKGFYMVGIGS